MADVALPGASNPLTGMQPHNVPRGGPTIEMVPNPDFSFPMQSRTASSVRRPEMAKDSGKTLASLDTHIAGGPHRRGASTLPSFSFNAADASGLRESNTPPHTPLSPADSANSQQTPSRPRHRRGGSEYVGGDSRLGVGNAMSSSPTKDTALSLPPPSLPAPPSAPITCPPSGRRGHAHRRSAAISNHDVKSLMQAPDSQPRTSTSLPSTPLDYGSQEPLLDRAISAPDAAKITQDPFSPNPVSADERPSSSSRRVGFSDTLEFIPRPLSTISSETESSISTLRGHSLNNSISSVLSFNTPSPPSSRTPRTPPRVTSNQDESTLRSKSSFEVNKRVEREGRWLKNRSSSNPLPPSIDRTAEPLRSVTDSKRRPSSSRGAYSKSSESLRPEIQSRRSEPTLMYSAGGLLGTPESSTSFGTSAEGTDSSPDSLTSTQKIRAWAASKMSKRSRESNRSVSQRSSSSSIRPKSAGSEPFARSPPHTKQPVAETDLDAVFGNQSATHDFTGSVFAAQSQLDAGLTAPTRQPHISPDESDASSPMVDLDAALGPLKTPPLGIASRQRKELHSSRLTKDFSGPGGHYHRRAESAPILAPFEMRAAIPQPAMADVFEEEEEDGEEENDTWRLDSSCGSTPSGAEDESSVGVQIVDADNSASTTSLQRTVDEGLGIQGGDGYFGTSGYYSSTSSTLPPPPSALEGRRSSILEETIMEEPGQIEGVEIVEAHEEPRSSSLTKSSDSSDTPTILGEPPLLALPTAHASAMTPETYQTSTFSSPDSTRRQSSFDTTRIGTAASSITDNRTMSSCTTTDQSQDLRKSVDDVPSLTSSHSTMLSTVHANSSRREFGVGERSPSANSSRVLDPAVAEQNRRKRSSIQSLSQLVGNSFGPKTRSADEGRPQTSATTILTKTPKKTEHRLKKLMFWKSKQSSKLSQSHSYSQSQT